MTIILDSNANPREVTPWSADEIITLRKRVQELEPFKAAYLEQVELHNKTLDELAACEKERDYWKEMDALHIAVLGKALEVADEGRNYANELLAKQSEQLATIEKDRDVWKESYSLLESHYYDVGEKGASSEALAEVVYMNHP